MAIEKKEEVDIVKTYGKSCITPSKEFLQKNNISFQGLNDNEAIANINKYGLNEIKQVKPKKWYNYFLSSLFNPFNSILLGITLVLFYTDVILPRNS